MEIVQNKPNASYSLKHDMPKWRFCIWIIALLPFLQAMLTWSFENKLVGAIYFVRHYSMPAVTGELAICVIVLASGFSIIPVARKLPLIVSTLIAVWLIFAISSTFHPDRSSGSSWYLVLRYILHGLFFASLVCIITNSKNFILSSWLQTIALGILLYVLVLVIFALVVPDKANFDWTQRMPSATNIRQIGVIIGIATIAPIALLLYNNHFSKWSTAIMIVLMFTFIAWSGTRTALVSIVLGVIGAIIFVRSIPQFRNIGILICSFIGGCLISLILPKPSSGFGLLRMLNQTQDSDDVSSGRTEVWHNTLTEIQKNPWIGYGSGNFRSNMNEIYGNILNHPHNFVLQFVYDWGILGASAALLLIGYLIWIIWKNARFNALFGFAAAAGIISLIVSASVEGALFHPLPIITALALIAPLFSRLNNHVDENSIA